MDWIGFSITDLLCDLGKLCYLSGPPFIPPFLSICDDVMAALFHSRCLLVQDGEGGIKKYSQILQCHLGTLHALLEKVKKNSLVKYGT